MSQHPDPEIAMIDKVIVDLNEHWECVQIFVSRVEDDGRTCELTRGCGNWRARTAQARAWVVRDDENSRLDQRESRTE